jgi:hypothetical protein
MRASSAKVESRVLDPLLGRIHNMLETGLTENPKAKEQRDQITQFILEHSKWACIMERGSF